MTQISKKTVMVAGSGSWGTAIALLLSQNGHHVRLWGRNKEYIEEMKLSRINRIFLPVVKIPEDVLLTEDVHEAVDGADLLVNAIPTQYIRSALREFMEGKVDAKIPVVSLSKGIENETMLRGSQIFKEVLGSQCIGVLSGPSHAEEVCVGMPSSVVFSSRDAEFASQMQDVFMTSTFRVYTNLDIIGVEVAGALKNVIALAAGMCDGLKFGTNSKSALLTRGLVEMMRFGLALGGKQSTFSGLAGIGDLITTCFSPYGRNRAVGEKIAQGQTLDHILKSMDMVAEGVWTTKSVYSLARIHEVDMPITSEIYKILYEGKLVKKALIDLMSRAKRSEEEN